MRIRVLQWVSRIQYLVAAVVAYSALSGQWWQAWLVPVFAFLGLHFHWRAEYHRQRAWFHWAMAGETQ